MDDKMTIYDVVKKLIGNIQPVGETNTDGKNLAHLKAMTELVDNLLRDIGFVATMADRQEYSIKTAGCHADGFLKEVGYI